MYIVGNQLISLFPQFDELENNHKKFIYDGKLAERRGVEHKEKLSLAERNEEKLSIVLRSSRRCRVKSS